MPRSKSAKKALRVSRRRRLLNLARKEKIRRAFKEFKKAPSEREGLLGLVFKALDKAGKKKILHPRRAARLKSRLAKSLRQGS